MVRMALPPSGHISPDTAELSANAASLRAFLELQAELESFHM
jgi:hypothetical protein